MESWASRMHPQGQLHLRQRYQALPGLPAFTGQHADHAIAMLQLSRNPETVRDQGSFRVAISGDTKNI